MVGPPASRAADERRRRGPAVEVGLDRLDGEYRCGRGPGGAQHLASASGIEGDRRFAVSGAVATSRSAPPSHLARCSATGKYISSATGAAGVGFDRLPPESRLILASSRSARPSFSLEKALEVNLVLAHRRRVELGLDRGAKAPDRLARGQNAEPAARASGARRRRRVRWRPARQRGRTRCWERWERHGRHTRRQQRAARGQSNDGGTCLLLGWVACASQRRVVQGAAKVGADVSCSGAEFMRWGTAKGGVERRSAGSARRSPRLSTMESSRG